MPLLERRTDDCCSVCLHVAEGRMEDALTVCKKWLVARGYALDITSPAGKGISFRLIRSKFL